MPWRVENFEKAGAQIPAFSMYEGAIETTRPDLQLTLWPNRSSGVRDMRIVLIIVAVGLSLPLFALMNSPVGWGMLPFFLVVLIGLYIALTRNYRDGALTEVLRLTSDHISVIRTEPNGNTKHWDANPYWVKVKLHPNAKLENYLTLSGNGRDIELGAFLSPEERQALYDALMDGMRRVSRHA